MEGIWIIDRCQGHHGMLLMVIEKNRMILGEVRVGVCITIKVCVNFRISIVIVLFIVKLILRYKNKKKHTDPDAHLKAKQVCEQIKTNAELRKRKKEEKLKQRQDLNEKKAKCSLIIKSEHLDEYEKLISNVRGYLYNLVWHCTQSKLKGALPKGKTRIGLLEAIVEDIYNLTKVRVKIETRVFDLLFYESMAILDNYTLEIDVDKLIELVKNGFVEKVNKEIVEKETTPVFTKKKFF